MKYLIEKGHDLPLCVKKDKIYFDYFTGQVITNENTLNFIDKYLCANLIEEKEISLNVYKIYSENNDYEIVAYNYEINGYGNYLSINRRLLNKRERQCITEGLINGKYKQIKIWGDNY